MLPGAGSTDPDVVSSIEGEASGRRRKVVAGVSAGLVIAGVVVAVFIWGPFKGGPPEYASVPDMEERLRSVGFADCFEFTNAPMAGQCRFGDGPPYVEVNFFLQLDSTDVIMAACRSTDSTRRVAFWQSGQRWFLFIEGSGEPEAPGGIPRGMTSEVAAAVGSPARDC
jgi:hypothetical protein